MRTFRGHGITTTASQREKLGAWFYEMTELGYNYRITDFQCALGSAQLTKLDTWINRRTELAQTYDAVFAEQTTIFPLKRRNDILHAYHLYVVRTPQRNAIFHHLRTNGIHANVHYVPVHLHPYYQRVVGTHEGLCPVAEAAYKEILTLPLWPGIEIAECKKIGNCCCGVSQYDFLSEH